MISEAVDRNSSTNATSTIKGDISDMVWISSGSLASVLRCSSREREQDLETNGSKRGISHRFLRPASNRTS